MSQHGDLGTIWASIGLDWSKFGFGVRQVGSQISLLDQNTQQAVTQIGQHWSKLGRTMTLAVTTPLVGIATQWTRTFAQFEQSMANTASVAGATAEEFDMLQQAARAAGAATVFSASQSADALYYLASAGFSAVQSAEALNGVLALAAATQSDLAFTSESVASAISQFNLEAEDAARIANVYSAAISGSQATMEKLADSMRYAGPIAGALGWTIEETSAALMGLYNAGLRGEQAGCYDRETEVLTKRGWLGFEDVTYDDEIATLNPNTHKLEWQKPTGLVNVPYKGKMYRVKSQYVDLLVTPNHWMYVRLRHHDDFQRIQAQDIAGRGVEYLTASEWEGNDQEIFVLPEVEYQNGTRLCKVAPRKLLMDDWLEFLGYWLAEGWTCYIESEGHYIVGLSQKPGVTKERMIEVARRIGNFRENGNDIVVCDLQLWTYLRVLGKQPVRCIPAELKELPRPRLRVLFEAFMAGDGSGDRAAWTSSEQLRDDLQEIGVKLGYGVQYSASCLPGESTYVESFGRTVTAKHTNWVLYFSPRTTPYFHQAHNERIAANRGQKTSTEEAWIDFDDRIYCAEVPNHIMLVRRNGKAVFCGNTTLRRAIQELSAPTGAAKDVLSELGLTAEQVHPELHNLADIMDTLTSAGMDTTQAMRLFGAQAGSGMVALLQQGGQALRDYQAGITGTNAAAEMAERQIDTLTGSLKLMRSAWEEMSISMAENFAPGVRAVVDQLADMFRAFSELDPATQRLILGIGGVTAAVGPLTFAIGKLMIALPALLGPAGLIALGVSSLTALGFAMVGAAADADKFYERSEASARAARNQSDELRKLVDEYRNLEGKPDRSEIEHARLEEVMRRIVDVQPLLVSGYDDVGEAIIKNIGLVGEYADQLRQQSDLEIELAAQRAEIAQFELNLAKERLEAERAVLQAQLGPEHEKALTLIGQNDMARLLYNQADAAYKAGKSTEEAYAPLIKHLMEIGRLEQGADFSETFRAMNEALNVLGWEANRAEQIWGRTIARLTGVKNELELVNEQLAKGAEAIKRWEQVQSGINPWEGLGSQNRNQQNQSEEETKTGLEEELEDEKKKTEKTIQEILAKEQLHWQARINLVRAGVEEYVERYGSVENAQRMYLDWLNRIVRGLGPDKELLEFRGRLASNITSIEKELEKLGQKVTDPKDIKIVDVNEIWAEFEKLMGAFGPMKDRLYEEVAVGNLPFLGDDMEEMAARLNNYYQDMLQTQRITLEEHLSVLEHQLNRLVDAGKTGTDEWLRLRQQIRDVEAQLAREQEQLARDEEAREQQRRNVLRRSVEEQERAARKQIEIVQTMRQMGGMDPAEEARRLQNIFDKMRMSPELMGQLSRQIVDAQRRALELADEIARKQREKELRAAEEQDRLVQGNLRKAVQAQEERVRVQTRVVQEIVDTEGIGYREHARMLENIVNKMRMSEELQRDIRHRIRNLNILADGEEEASELQKQQNLKNDREQSARDQERAIRRQIENVNRITEREGLGLRDQIAELQKVQMFFAGAMPEHLSGELQQRIAVFTRRAEEQEEAAKLAAEEQEKRHRERANQEYQRDIEDRVRGQLELIRRLTEIQGLGYREQADLLGLVVDYYKDTYEHIGDIVHRAAMLRKQADEEELEDATRRSKEAAREQERIEREHHSNLERIRRETVQRNIDEIRHQAFLEDWDPGRLASAIEEKVAEMKMIVGLTEAEIRQFTMEVQRLYKQASDAQIRELDRVSKEEQRIIDDRARASVQSLERRAREEGWLTSRLADEMQALLQELVYEEGISTQLRVSISNRALDLRIQGLQEAKREEERIARELARSQEQARAESVRAQEQDIRYRTNLFKLSYEEQAEEYRNLLFRMDLTDSERDDFSKKWIDLSVKAQEEANQKRLEHEKKWQQFLLESGVTTQQELLQNEIEAIQERLSAQKAGSDEYEQISQELIMKQRELQKQELEDQKAALRLWVIEGRLSTDEHLSFVQELLGGYMELYGALHEQSREYQELKKDELSLLEQQQIELAQTRIASIASSEDSIEALRAQQAELMKLMELASSDKVKALYAVVIRGLESEVQKLLRAYRQQATEAVNQYSRTVKDMERAELSATMSTIQAVIEKMEVYEELADVVQRLRDLQEEIRLLDEQRARRWGRTAVDPSWNSELVWLTTQWNQLADIMERVFSDNMLMRLQSASSTLGAMSEGTGAFIEKIHRSAILMRDLPAQFEDALQTMREFGADIGGPGFGRYLGGLAGALTGATQANLSPLGSILGGISGLLTGLGVGGPWAGITAGLGIIGNLFDPGPAPQNAQQLQQAVKDVNKALAEWSVAYRSAQVSIQKTYFLFWQTGWKITGEAAAREGVKIGQEMIRSMETTLNGLGSALAQTIGQRGTWDDFQQALGNQLRRLLMEEVMKAAAFEEQAKLLVGQMHEAVAGGFTETEVDRIRRQWQALFNELDSTWEEFSKVLDSLFPEDDTTVEHRVQGVQITRLAGRDRDLFVELLRPLSNLDRMMGVLANQGFEMDLMVAFHDAHIAELIASEVIIEYVQNVQFAGVIERLSVDGRSMEINMRSNIQQMIQGAIDALRARGATV